MTFAGSRRDITFACLILGCWAIYATFANWGKWPVDMSALYMAARFVSLGEWASVYEAPTGFFSAEYPARWLAELEAMSHSNEVALPYVYPPVWAWLLSPFGLTDPILFYNISRILLFAAAGLSVYLLWKMAQPARISATTFAIVAVILCEVTIPFKFAEMLAQPQLLLLCMILLSFERFLAGAWKTAGIVLGLAAAIKITPIFLALVFLAEREWRTAAVAGGVAGGVAVVSFAVAGIDPHLAFLERLDQIDQLVPLIGLNTTFEGVMHSVFVPVEARRATINTYVGDNVAWITWLNRALLLAALVAALTAGNGRDRRARIVLRLLTVTLATTLFSPLSWVHYYILPILAVPLFPMLVGPRVATLIAVPMVLILSMPMARIMIPVTTLDGFYQVLCWTVFAALLAVLRLGPLPASARSIQPSASAHPA